MNQILSFIGTVKGEGQAKLSDGSHLLSNASMTKLGSNGNWTPDKQSFNNVWNVVANIRSGRSLGCGDFFNGMNTFADLGGLGADILKATGTLGTIGVWRNFSKVCTYSSGWKGNGTVRTFGSASTLGYGMFGLSVIANLGLTYKNQQSITAAGVNIGINTLMLKLPLPVSIGYGVGSTVYQIQQSTLNTLIENGHGDNPGLFNEDFLH